MAVSGKVRVKKCEISEKVRAEKWKFWYGLFVNHKAALPLKFYEGMESFKLYYLDCGLMGALTEAPADQILIGD